MRTPEQQLTFLQTNVHVRNECLIWAGSCSTVKYPYVRWEKKRWRTQALQHFLITGKQLDLRAKGFVFSCGEQRCMNLDHYKVVPRKRVLRKSRTQILKHLRENVYQIEATNCVRWAGPFSSRSRKNSPGTPLVFYNGSMVSARRLLWKLTHKNTSLSPDQKITLSCNTPNCMNSNHFVVVTQGELSTLLASRNKYPRGYIRAVSSYKGHAKTARVTIHDREQVHKFLQQGLTHKQIGEHFGVKGSSISSMIRRWRQAEVIAW